MTALIARHDAAVAEYLAALLDAVCRGYKMPTKIPPGCGGHNYAANGGK